jgi:hypothetical protein
LLQKFPFNCRQDIHDVSQHLNLYLFVIKIMQEYCKWSEEQWIFFPKKIKNKKQSTWITITSVPWSGAQYCVLFKES